MGVGRYMGNEISLRAEEGVEPVKSMNLFQKLVELRKSVVYIKETEKGYGNFNYANTASLIAILRPKMDELGLLLVPSMESFESGHDGKSFIKIQMSYTWVNAERPEERLTSFATYEEDKIKGCQGSGSVQTYAERYFLYRFFQIATDKDNPEEYYKKHGISAIENESEEKPVEEKPRAKKPEKKEKEYSGEKVLESEAIKLWDNLGDLIMDFDMSDVRNHFSNNPDRIRHLKRFLYIIDHSISIDIKEHLSRLNNEEARDFLRKFFEYSKTQSEKTKVVDQKPIV